MNIERLQAILDAFGADPRRWPEAERDAALALVAGDAEARFRQKKARRLDTLLDEAAPVHLDLDAAAIVAGVTGATANVRRFPGKRPAPFTVIWPSFAGLAAAAVAGFVIGWLNLANYGFDTQTAVSDQPASLSYSEVEPW